MNKEIIIAHVTRYFYGKILCFALTQITFDNRAHSGKINVDVENDVRIFECRDWNVEGSCKSVLLLFFFQQ